MSRPVWGGSQTRVCGTGPQFIPFSLVGCGSQSYRAISASWRESDSRDLWLRPHQPVQSLRAAGQRPGNPGTNSRRGWHSLDSRLAQGDTLIVVSIDRIGRRGVAIRSLADNEQSWAQYLEADPDSPESFMGYTLAGIAAWVSDQELVSIRRTKAGLEKARADGRKLGAPRRLSEEQEAAVVEMVASGVSQRRVSRSFGVSPATVRRAVKRE